MTNTSRENSAKGDLVKSLDSVTRLEISQALMIGSAGGVEMIKVQNGAGNRLENNNTSTLQANND